MISYINSFQSQSPQGLYDGSHLEYSMHERMQPVSKFDVNLSWLYLVISNQNASVIHINPDES